MRSAPGVRIQGPSFWSSRCGTAGDVDFAPKAVLVSSVPEGSARAATSTIGYTAAPNVCATRSGSGDARSMRVLRASRRRSGSA